MDSRRLDLRDRRSRLFPQRLHRLRNHDRRRRPRRRGESAAESV